MQTANESIKRLNSFLRGEISAVETYRQALEKVEYNSIARTALKMCQQSHADRILKLRDRIVELGGEPDSSSGVWGVFAKSVEGSAKVFGEKTAIAALEEGEDHGLRDYRSDVEKLDARERVFVETQILPAQERTHEAMSRLKHTLH